MPYSFWYFVSMMEEMRLEPAVWPFERRLLFSSFTSSVTSSTFRRKKNSLPGMGISCAREWAQNPSSR